MITGILISYKLIVIRFEIYKRFKKQESNIQSAFIFEIISIFCENLVILTNSKLFVFP